MNKYYLNPRSDVKVQKQRCHLFEPDMSPVAMIVPSSFFSSPSSFCSCSSRHFLLRRPLVHLQTLMSLCSVKEEKKKKVGRTRKCLVRSPFFSCAFFPLAMSLFDMPFVHEVCS